MTQASWFTTNTCTGTLNLTSHIKEKSQLI